MDRYFEMAFSQFLGFQADGWIPVICLAGLFLIGVMRPQAAQSVMFNSAVVLYALYVVVPPSFTALLMIFTMESGFSGGDEGGMMTTLQLVRILGRVLLGLSILFALLSLRTAFINKPPLYAPVSPYPAPGTPQAPVVPNTPAADNVNPPGTTGATNAPG